jgi:hypothetical protein
MCITKVEMAIENTLRCIKITSLHSKLSCLILHSTGRRYQPDRGMNMTNKHTPGPWSADVSTSNGNGWTNDRQVVTVTGEGGNTLIALYSTECMEYPNNETNSENARLIASAPDLLAALEEIETVCTESASDCRKRMGTRVGNALVAARAAIAKARGE